MMITLESRGTNMNENSSEFIKSVHFHLSSIASHFLFFFVTSLQVLMPDTALTPGSPSPLAQAVSRFDSDISLTAVNRGAFNDTEGIQWVQKLAVVDHLNILVLIEHK